MAELSLPLYPIKGLPPALVRPLPTIFNYVRLTMSETDPSGPVARRMFSAHVQALKGMLILTIRGAGLPPASIQSLLDRCDALKQCKGKRALVHLEELRHDLLDLHGKHGKLVKETVSEHKDRLRELFRGETGPRRLRAVFNDETWEDAEALRAKLADHCWYDCEVRHESESLPGLDAVDMVLLVPGIQPIREGVTRAVAAAHVPTLVLTGAGKADATDMASLKTEHLYRTRGFQVVRKPFAAIRLYQAVDAHYLAHADGHQVAPQWTMAAVT